MRSTVHFKPALGVATALLLSSSTTTLAQTPAPPTSGNPPGAQYVAALTGSLSGSVIASSSSNGSGVDFQINVLGLPASGGPFLYYLTPSTSCSGDPPVLDPYKAQSGSECSQGSPQSCAIGDLWGKHGKMERSNFNTQYIDLYLSTIRDAPAFLGGSSVVVQSSNKTNLACVPFTANGSPGSGASSSSPSANAPDSPAAAPPSSASAPLAAVNSANTIPMGPSPVMMSGSGGVMPGAASGPTAGA